jgi:hypothetical protein
MSRPSPEPKISVEEAFSEAQRNGLLGEMDLAAFRDELQRFHKILPPRIDSSDVLEVLVTHLLRGTPAVLLTKPSEGLVVGRDVHEGEEPEVQAELLRFAAHFGLSEELLREIADQRVAMRYGDDDLLDEVTLFEILGRTFARARRPERVVHLRASVQGFGLLVRVAMHPGALRLFHGEATYRPEDDWRRSEPAFLAEHGVASPSPEAPPLQAETPPAPQPAPASAGPTTAPGASLLQLERFEMAARKLVFAAQGLADERGHLHVEPLHVAVRLLERDIEPGKARVALQLAEQSMARLPTAAPGEPASVSTATLKLFKETERLAEGRPADTRDLWRAIRRLRGTAAALVLEAALPDAQAPG